MGNKLAKGVKQIAKVVEAPSAVSQHAAENVNTAPLRTAPRPSNSRIRNVSVVSRNPNEEEEHVIYTTKEDYEFMQKLQAFTPEEQQKYWEQRTSIIREAFAEYRRQENVEATTQEVASTTDVRLKDAQSSQAQLTSTADKIMRIRKKQQEDDPVAREARERAMLEEDKLDDDIIKFMHKLSDNIVTEEVQTTGEPPAALAAAWDSRRSKARWRQALENQPNKLTREWEAQQHGAKKVNLYDMNHFVSGTFTQKQITEFFGQVSKFYFSNGGEEATRKNPETAKQLEDHIQHFAGQVQVPAEELKTIMEYVNYPTFVTSALDGMKYGVWYEPVHSANPTAPTQQIEQSEKI